MAVERLLDTVDINPYRHRTHLERVAVPDHQIAHGARREDAGLAAHAADARRHRGDGSKCLPPAQPVRTGNAGKRNEIARVLVEVARVLHRSGIERDPDPGFHHPADVALRGRQFLEVGGQIVQPVRDDRYAGGCDFVGNQPAFARANQHEVELRELALERECAANVGGALHIDVEWLLAAGDGRQCGSVEAREQDVIAADVGAGGRAVGAGFAQCGAQQCVRGDAAAARNPTTIFPERDDLEGARLRDCIGIGTQIDHRALAAEDRARRQGDRGSARDPRSAVHEDVLRGGIDHRCHIERGAKRRTPGARVVRFAHRTDVPQTEAGDGRENARGDPGAVRIDRGKVAGGRTAADRGNLAVLDNDIAALDRFAAIARGDSGVGYDKALRGGRRAQGDGGGGEKRCKSLHFTSPSPGCPSSKSLTGRRLRSIASNISAPSTQIFSGRE